jgi:hypothetical protein
MTCASSSASFGHRLCCRRGKGICGQSGRGIALPLTWYLKSNQMMLLFMYVCSQCSPTRQCKYC